MERLVDGRYLPLQERGRGAVAAVWRARDRLSGKEVALKVPLPRSGARGRREILDEARALCRLDQEGIVRLLAVESAFAGPLPRGTPYLVLEHLRARPARHALLSGSPAELSAVAGQCLEALGHLHAARLLHRDLKPDNLLLEHTPRGPRATLIDLGSSTPQGRGRGRYAGSAAWAAPEVLLGGRADPRSDLYSLGRVLHHLAGGQPPFDPEDPFGVSRWLLRPGSLPPAAGLGSRMSGFIAGLTRPLPGERPPSASAALRQLAEGPVPRISSSPLVTPRGFLRSLRRGLRWAREGESVFLERRVRGARARGALLSRAAIEGIRAGFAPLRLAPGDAPPPAAAGHVGLLRARQATGGPLLLLLDGAAWAPWVLREQRRPFLLLLLRDGRAYNPGP